MILIRQLGGLGEFVSIIPLLPNLYFSFPKSSFFLSLFLSFIFESNFKIKIEFKIFQNIELRYPSYSRAMDLNISYQNITLVNSMFCFYTTLISVVRK